MDPPRNLGSFAVVSSHEAVKRLVWFPRLQLMYHLQVTITFFMHIPIANPEIFKVWLNTLPVLGVPDTVLAFPFFDFLSSQGKSFVFVKSAIKNPPVSC
jgi:hypothetical protein